MNVLKIGLRASAGIVVTAVMAGCAGVDFYSEPGLKTRTGIPIYRPKPYVLVARTKNKEKPVEVSIQYLPDYSSVIYARPHSGFGSADLKLALANGQLTQFGQVTDTKVPELVTAVSGLLTARATATKTLAEADQIRSTTHAAKIPDSATFTLIEDLHEDMSVAEALADMDKLDPKGERPIFQEVVLSLGNMLKAKVNPALASLLPRYGDQLIAAAKKFNNLPVELAAAGSRTSALQRIRDWKPRLQAIVEKISSDDTPAPAAPDFELYEIEQKSGIITLHRVQ